MKALKTLKIPNKKNFIIFFCIGAFLIFVFIYYQVIKTADQFIPNQPINYSADTPDEQKPDKKFKWNGTANDPKFIKLPSIGAEGYVQKVGVDQNSQIAVPGNIHIAGWFTDSVLPGEKGLSIIDGHVNGWTSEGIFKRLNDLKAEDKFTIETGDGTIKSFLVKKIVELPTSESASVLFSQDPSIARQVNLITCGGNFDPASKQYDKRIIVISELVD